MNLILNGNLKPNVLFQQIQYTNAFFDAMHAVGIVISYINANVGFTVIGCY